MINYIINFIICSGLLLLVYRVFLGTENLYRFNRFYLLFSLVFSLVVPATTIHVPYLHTPAWDKLLANQSAQPRIAIQRMPIEDAQPQTIAQAIAATNVIADEPATERIIATPPVSNSIQPDTVSQPQPARHYLPEILMALYGVVTLVLLVRFVWNSYHITRVVAGSTVIDYQDIKLVLVTDDVTPHSFLKYVFLNKWAYYNKTIEPEIICHEQTHVRQLHSLDVIGVELLQIVCWFNFFIPFYRKAIQLNHEFLADEAVIANYRDTSAYQHLLLAKASQSGSLYLTSQFNYVVTKKRIIMMTKRTTAAIALYKRLALLPVLGAAIFLFSQKSLAQTAKKAQPEKKQPVAKKVESKPQSTAIEAAKQDAPQSVLEQYAKILAKYHIPFQIKTNYLPDFSAADKERLTTLYKQMSSEQQQHQYVRVVHPKIPPPNLLFTENDLRKWQDNVGYIVYIDDKQIKNAELAKYKAADFRNALLNQVPVPSTKSGWHWRVTLMTPAYYKQYLEKQVKEHLVYVPKEWWKYENRSIVGAVLNNTYTPKMQVIPAAQHDAPAAVTDEYAAILKKYGLKQYMNNSDFKNIDIWNPRFFAEADRARLLTLYKQMSKKQQDQQVIMFNASPSPLSKKNPTEQQLAAWKDAKEYGVWIDGKKIKNEELSKYRSSDFDLYLVSRLTSAARKHTPCHYQVNLSTKAKYAAYYKQAKAKEGRPNVLVHIIPGPVVGSTQPMPKVDVNTRVQVGDHGRRLPLIVVNGKPFEKPIPIDFNFNKATNADYARLLEVSEKDISKITVLKKEEATNQWGERGAYGVLMIYTTPGLKTTITNKNRPLPLVVLDGKPFNKPMPAKFNYGATDADYARLLGIDTLDILSISVLKGEAGKAAWGSRGENSVIVINTKNGGNGLAGGNTKQPGTKIKSIDKDHQPLIVLDGKVIDKKFPSGFSSDNKAQTADLLSISPADIQSVNVIKDTSAIATWGKKAVNGVVIFTTKRRTEKKQQD